MRALDAERIVTAWEQGRRRHPLDRGLLLFALAEPGHAPDTLADRPLSERNAALLRLRQASFGNALDAWVDCPNCGERLAFTLDLATLLRDYAPPPTSIEAGDHLLRPPTSRDLALIAQDTDPERAALTLLRLCTTRAPDTARTTRATDLDALEAALEAADPWSDLALELNCDRCGHAWHGTLDVTTVLWEELETTAHRLLDEVHLLARAYGWPEAEILALSTARRAAYIERVLA
ncbi:MAG: hypothetical protein ACFCUJ_10030 [Thiotrichales bacterium]